MNDLPHLDGEMVWMEGFYDGPLSGVCRLAGQRRLYWFAAPNGPDDLDENDQQVDRVWLVYELSDSDFRAVVESHLVWEDGCGTHHCLHGRVPNRVHTDPSNPEVWEALKSLMGTRDRLPKGDPIGQLRETRGHRRYQTEQES